MRDQWDKKRRTSHVERRTLKSMNEVNTPALGLALGGGGMKGLAHVGALSILEAYHLKPQMIAGTSIGALVGVFYAAGYGARRLEKLMQDLNFLGLLGARFDGKGLLDVDKLEAYLHEHLGVETFEDLSIPLKVVCTDLETGEAVVFDQGPLVKPVLASTTIPGVFAPIRIEGRVLVDGGLRNNLPVSVLVEAGMTHTIGIRLFRQMSDWKLAEQEEDEKKEKWAWIKPSRWGERLAEEVIENLPEVFTVAQRALDLIVMQAEQEQLERYRPNVLIEPEVTHIGILDFHEEKDPLFDLGIAATLKHTAALESLRQELTVS